MILIIFGMRRHPALVTRYNITPLTILLIGCVLRLVLPLEFPGFTEPIYSTKVFVSFNTVMYSPLFEVGEDGLHITPVSFAFLIWMGVSLALLINLLRSYLTTIWKINKLERLTSGPVFEQAAALAKDSRIPYFRLFRGPQDKVPFMTGLLFPRVVLPNRPYTEKQLRYILMHELTHWKNGDMVVRLMTLLTCFLFWWNPLVYLLFYDLEQILELRCDGSIVGAWELDDEERDEYLDTIMVTIEQLRDSADSRSRSYLSSEFCGKIQLKISKHRQKAKLRDFKQRIDMIGDYKKDRKKERILAIFTTAIMIVTILFSYRYVVQPYYQVPETEFVVQGGLQELTVDTGYLVLEDDGNYSFYFNGEFLRTVSPDAAEKLIQDGFPVKPDID